MKTTAETKNGVESVRALSERIERAKRTNAHTVLEEHLARQWDELLRRHARRREALEVTGSRRDQMLEDLRFDLEIVKHSLRRWVRQH